MLSKLFITKALKRLWIILIVFCSLNSFGQSDFLQNPVSLSVDSMKLDEALDLLSKECECYFTYDANKINGNKHVSLKIQNTPLLSILDSLIDLPDLLFTEYRNQVVISIGIEKIPKTVIPQKESYINVNGKVVDIQTRKPLLFASIAIKGEFFGTICNEKGLFSIRIPRKYENDTLIVSYLGYYNERIAIGVNDKQDLDIGLLQGVVSLQEIVVRKNDPKKILEKAIRKIDDNYQTQPFNYEAFYREGIECDKEFVKYTEALLKGYKPKLHNFYSTDKVQVLHSRQFSNIHNNDTVAVKISAGLESCFKLDIIDDLPDFLDIDGFQYYDYNVADILVWQKTLVYQIDFMQKGYVEESLPEGIIYVSIDDYAIIGAEFRFSEDKIKNISSSFVVRKSRKIKVRPKGSDYFVRYKKSGDRYYLSHVRGKLLLNVKRKRLQFSKNYSILIEMAITDIKEHKPDKQFDKENLIKTNSIFSESKFIYEHNYWGVNNTIQPEPNILKAFKKAGLRVLEISSEGLVD